MISVNGITVSYGGFTLLDNISFHISEKDKIGLAGKNGAGKSTLLKIIVGINTPTSGSVAKPAGMKIGYLPQQMEHAKDKSVIDEAMTAFSHYLDMQNELESALEEMSRREDYESEEYHDLMVRINDLNDRISVFSGDSPRVQSEKTLLGLGFRKEDMERPTATFSQGWNMRIELAKILLSKPDVLLLDEPTNHLDIESIEWLEDYLKAYSGSIVLISHDRKFLDNITNRTVEIMLGHIHDYKVPYSKYLVLRKERIEQQRAAYENQQRMIEKTEEFIERFRYKPTKSNQVQSRIKQLDRLERIEIDEEDRSALNVKFPPAPRSGQVVFKASDAQASYGTKVIFSHADMVIERGEKVAFVGRNGEGKTTMVRLIMKELYPSQGECETGHNVFPGYYAQNQDDILEKTDTVFETLDRIATGDIRTKLRDILAAFLFKGEDIDKKVAVLSGGERARLAMAKLMLNPYNLLVLDEPTNHMDIRSKDVLKQALMAYDGTLILVSHDRDFLDGLVDKLYEFRDGKVKEHLGGVNDFLQRKKMENLKEIERTSVSPQHTQTSTALQAEAVSGTGNADRKNGSEDYAKRKMEEKERRKLRNSIRQCEEKIAGLENEIRVMEERIASPGPEDDIVALSNDYHMLQKELDGWMEKWMEYGEE